MLTCIKEPTYEMSTPLPGETQTNNRAELYALLLVAQNPRASGQGRLLHRQQNSKRHLQQR